MGARCMQFSSSGNFSRIGWTWHCKHQGPALTPRSEEQAVPLPRTHSSTSRAGAASVPVFTLCIPPLNFQTDLRFQATETDSSWLFTFCSGVSLDLISFQTVSSLHLQGSHLYIGRHPLVSGSAGTGRIRTMFANLPWARDTKCSALQRLPGSVFTEIMKTLATGWQEFQSSPFISGSGQEGRPLLCQSFQLKAQQLYCSPEHS